MIWLSGTLNSPEGHALTADSLATLSEDRSIRSIALPVSATDVLPHMGTYRHVATGGTLTFRPYANEKDTINPVCKVDLRVVIHSYYDTTCLPDTAETACVQNRGKGILAFYHIVHGGGPNGGRHRCYDKHPDGYPQYWGALVAVHPGADSLTISWGYEESKRTYHFLKD